MDRLYVLRFPDRPDTANEVFPTLQAALARVAEFPPSVRLELVDLDENGDTAATLR